MLKSIARRFFAPANMGQEAPQQSVICECGCGNSYPESEMIAIQTGCASHPVEMIYDLHFEEVYSQPLRAPSSILPY